MQAILPPCDQLAFAPGRHWNYHGLGVILEKSPSGGRVENKKGSPPKTGSRDDPVITIQWAKTTSFPTQAPN